MPRPREFDENDVLGKAMECFWQRGYEGASIAQLERATGITRISLYNAFKDKESLFIAAQKIYFERNRHYMRETFVGDKLTTLIDFLRRTGTSTDVMYRGCMMVNTSLEAHRLSPEICQNVRDFRKMMIATLTQYLTRCRKAGQLHKHLDLGACARFVLTNLWGAAVVTRLEQNPRPAKDHMKMVIATVKTWQPQS